MSEQATPALKAISPAATGRHGPVVATLFLGAAVASTVALFPPYYQGHPGLTASPETILYNLPSLTGWAIAGLLTLGRQTGAIGAALGTALTALWTPAIIIDIGNMVSADDTPAAGIVLTCVGLVLAIAASGCAFRFGHLGGRPGRPPIVPAAAVTVAGIAYTVGLLFPRQRVTARLSTPGMTFPFSGTDTMTWECCGIGEQPLYHQVEMVIVALLALAVPLVAMVARRDVRLGLLVGTALGWAGLPIGTITRLLQPLGPADIGYSEADAAYAGLTLTQQPLPGLWTMIGAVVLLAAVAAVHAARRPPGEPSTASPDEAGSAR